jgi:hypothetical protein
MQNGGKPELTDNNNSGHCQGLDPLSRPPGLHACSACSLTFHGEGAVENFEPEVADSSYVTGGLSSRRGTRRELT